MCNTLKSFPTDAIKSFPIFMPVFSSKNLKNSVYSALFFSYSGKSNAILFSSENLIQQNSTTSRLLYTFTSTIKSIRNLFTSGSAYSEKGDHIGGACSDKVWASNLDVYSRHLVSCLADKVQRGRTVATSSCDPSGSLWRRVHRVCRCYLKSDRTAFEALLLAYILALFLSEMKNVFSCI